MASLKKIALGISVGVAMCSGSTMAVAANAAAQPVPMVNPLATISVFASPAAASALCGNSAATAAASSAAAAAQAPGAGCVLPVVDAPPPVVQPPAAAVPVASPSVGVLPILLALAGLGGLIYLISRSDDNDGELQTPISPV